MRRYHVTTFGCQMNAHDSERIKGMLESLGLGEVRGKALIGLLAHRARVEDDHVGLVLRPRLAETERFEHSLDALGIVSVHLAAEGGDVVAPHGRSMLRKASVSEPPSRNESAQR